MPEKARKDRLTELEQRLDRVAGMGVRVSYDDIEALGGPSRFTVLRRVKAGTWPRPIQGVGGTRFLLDEVREALNGREDWSVKPPERPRQKPRRRQ